MPTTWPRRWLAAAYIATVVTLAAIAWGHDHSGFYPVEAAALVLVLPLALPAFPVLYVVGGITFGLTGAPDNGPMWPVALTFAVMLGGCACLNVWLLHVLVTRRRTPHDPSHDFAIDGRAA